MKIDVTQSAAKLKKLAQKEGSTWSMDEIVYAIREEQATQKRKEVIDLLDEQAKKNMQHARQAHP
jgi:hypothetical protein